MNAPDRKPRPIPRALAIAAGAAALGSLALAPAGAEDSGRWEVFRANNARDFRPLAPAPGFTVVRPYFPRMEPPRSQLVRLPPGPVVKPVPPDPSKRENPLAAILRDPTLRYGDVVMFPEGPRVFRGDPGGRHSLQDFVSLAASREVPNPTRKKLLAMPIGENNAWSSDLGARTGKIARSAVDVETTGSIDRVGGKTVTVTTGRGDVRIIRVPD